MVKVNVYSTFEQQKKEQSLQTWVAFIWKPSAISLTTKTRKKYTRATSGRYMVPSRVRWPRVIIANRLVHKTFKPNASDGYYKEAGWSSGNTYSGLSHWRPGFDSRSGGSSEKVWEYLRWIFISRLPSPKPDTGVYKRDLWGRANYLCMHCFLWPGTLKSWWKPSPGQADHLHTLQHSPHTCIQEWREGKTGRYVLRPKKIVGAMRHSP